VAGVAFRARSHHTHGPHHGAELVLTTGRLSGHLPAETARTSTSFTIFEGTSEIQRMIIGRAVTGLDVR
jgi:alkylation response protein AidB-like acyl-CoA dehydrogenase